MIPYKKKNTRLDVVREWIVENLPKGCVFCADSISYRFPYARLQVIEILRHLRKSGFLKVAKAGRRGGGTLTTYVRT